MQYVIVGVFVLVLWAALAGYRNLRIALTLVDNMLIGCNPRHPLRDTRVAYVIGLWCLRICIIALIIGLFLYIKAHHW
jgi:hypothetical protein